MSYPSNCTGKTVRAGMAVISSDVLAMWLGVDPEDVIAVDVAPVNALRVVYRDIERGVVTPTGAAYAITRQLSAKTTREIEDR